jgi:hypothetical protein
MFARHWSLLGMLLLAAPSPAWAGAWTLPAGQGQVIVSGLASQANESFDGSRNTTGTPRYSKIELEGLLEYGLSDALTLMAAPGFQHIDIAAPTDAARTGFGYSELGARYRFLHGDGWVFSGQSLLRIPGTNQSANPAAVGYTNPELDMRALFGHDFNAFGVPGFVDLQVAQRFRFGDPPDEFRFDATFGLRPGPRWLLLAQSFNVISEGAGSGVLFPAYDYEKLQLSAVYSLTPALALQLGAFTTYSGRNALQENGLVAGLWYKF